MSMATADAFLAELATRAAPGLRAIFSCCEGFAPEHRSGRVDEGAQRAGRGELRELARPHRAAGPRRGRVCTTRSERHIESDGARR